MAADCAVLLKNDGGTLPLTGGGPIAVVGEFARTPRYQGGGSSHVNPTRVDAALDAIRALAAGPGRDVGFAPGFTVDGSGDAAALREEAVAAARHAEVTVVFAGLGEREESEGFDRETLGLPAAQVDVIRAVAAASPRTVVVLSHGGVVSLEGWHDDVDAILDGFLLGQAGGPALADLLFGVANPSGHLAETIPLRLADNPSYVNFPGEQGHVRYGEGVMVGYRWYDTVGLPVRYPFGHGLSYTTFSTGDLTVEVTGPDTARAFVAVTNTGGRAGQHVVQLYVATTAGPARRPSRELRAFTKVSLEPGETRTVPLDLDRRAFAYYDLRAAGWIVAPGTYLIQIGENAATVVGEAAITLTGDVVIAELTLDSTVGDWFTHPVVGATLLDELTAGMSDEQRAGLPGRPGSAARRGVDADPAGAEDAGRSRPGGDPGAADGPQPPPRLILPRPRTWQGAAAPACPAAISPAAIRPAGPRRPGFRSGSGPRGRRHRDRAATGGCRPARDPPRRSRRRSLRISWWERRCRSMATLRLYTFSTASATLGRPSLVPCEMTR